MSLYANIESSLAAHRAGSDQRQEDDRRDVVLVRLERVFGYLEDISRRLDQLPVRDEFEIGEI